MKGIEPPATIAPACMTTPDRWFKAAAGNDTEAIELCQACPLVHWCAYDALRTPQVSGLWAGVYVPIVQRGGKDWRKRQLARAAALDRLKKIARLGGYPVKKAA